MTLNVKYFGALIEVTGKSEQELQLEDGPSLNDFTELIESLYPKLQGFVFQLAVNQSVTTENIKLNDGDEIALLPPFAGG